MEIGQVKCCKAHCSYYSPNFLLTKTVLSLLQIWLISRALKKLILTNFASFSSVSFMKKYIFSGCHVDIFTNLTSIACLTLQWDDCFAFGFFIHTCLVMWMPWKE